MTITKIHTTTKLFTDIRGHQLFYCLVGLLGVMLALYLYLLSTTVVNIVVRKNIENDSKAKISTIGNLELSYLNVTALHDRTYITEAGFVEPNTIYVSRGTFLSQANREYNEL